MITTLYIEKTTNYISIENHWKAPRYGKECAEYIYLTKRNINKKSIKFDKYLIGSFIQGFEGISIEHMWHSVKLKHSWIWNCWNSEIYSQISYANDND